jgi:hypothetical protein
MTQFVSCPEPGCQAIAEIVARWVWPSTDGPVEHVKTHCLCGHWRTPIAETLEVEATPDRVAHPSTRWN